MVPFIPDTAPFTSEQRAWLNGLFAGVFSRSLASQPETLAPPSPKLVPITILFGSQTGTAEGLARRTAKEAGKRGFAPTILDMAQIDAARLGQEKNLLVITSTYGDGEPPDNARTLHADLAGKCALLADTTPAGLPYSGIRYSVCALGDTNYAQFCRCGHDFDVYLGKLGASRIAPCADCDLDFEARFVAWLDASFSALATGHSSNGRSADAVVPSEPPPSAPETAGAATKSWSRQHPYAARVIASHNLNGAGSAKQIQHVAFEVGDSGLAYEAGDALGVFPHNCPSLVADVLGALGCDGEEAVPAPDGTTTSLRRALAELYDLGRPSPELLAQFGFAGGGGVSVALHHVVDVLLACVGVKVAPADFVRALKKLQPRLYSISSSPRAHAGEVHLTVGTVQYDLHGRSRKGVCSTFLAQRVVAGESRVGIFTHSNKAFRLPADGAAPVLMVGPGTGIAPFRAFLHERRATGAKGRNWLFFGDQRAATDFLYREELAALMRDGVLTRLDTAFSRDQAEKIYVQHRMLEQAGELFAWLEAGAHFYVCGDANRMARDVDAALHQVIERGGGKTGEQAAAYVAALKAARRYARDVY